MRSLLLGATAAAALAQAAAGCGDSPSGPGNQPAFLVRSGFYEAGLAEFLAPPRGASTWTWSSPDGSTGGAAELEIAANRWRWALRGPAGAADDESLFLAPAEPLLWHGFSVSPQETAAAGWLPLPRRPVLSAYYADLLELTQRLTGSRFGSVVSRWPGSPVPIRAAAAVSGEVDLRECLKTAAAIWNDDPLGPFFTWDPEAEWGVQLLHRDIVQHPPLAVKMLRLMNGNPLVMRIMAGNNYNDPVDRRYATRGLVHELGHCLCLWDHSEDRGHTLWRCGPIVDRPSDDERRAARLWSLLPDGLDLKRYGRSLELDPYRHQGQGASVEHPRGRQPTVIGQAGQGQVQR